MSIAKLMKMLGAKFKKCDGLDFNKSRQSRKDNDC